MALTFSHAESAAHGHPQRELTQSGAGCLGLNTEDTLCCPKGTSTCPQTLASCLEAGSMQQEQTGPFQTSTWVSILKELQLVL